MPNTIEAGTILIKQGALLPGALQFESEPYARGWRLVKGLDGYALARRILDAGWTFFYMAGEIKATILGFDEPKARRKAIEQVLAQLKSEKCNSLEITEVDSKRFLGLPYASVIAHSRHIQEGLVLFRASSPPEWMPARRMAA